LLLEPYARIQLSILLSAINQMDRNGIFGLFRRNAWQPLAKRWGSVEPWLENNGVKGEDK